MSQKLTIFNCQNNFLHSSHCRNVSQQCSCESSSSLKAARYSIEHKLARSKVCSEMLFAASSVTAKNNTHSKKSNCIQCGIAGKYSCRTHNRLISHNRPIPTTVQQTLPTTVQIISHNHPTHFTHNRPKIHSISHNRPKKSLCKIFICFEAHVLNIIEYIILLAKWIDLNLCLVQVGKITSLHSTANFFPKFSNSCHVIENFITHHIKRGDFKNIKSI